MNGRDVFVGPDFMVAAGERHGIAHFDGQLLRTARPRLELHSSIGLAAASDDRHDGPVAPTKDAGKRLFIHRTWPGAVPWMRMDPDTSEFFRSPTEIDLPVEVIGNCVVCEGNGDE